MKNKETLFAGNCIRTVSGLYMDVFSPTPEMICIDDIAHALSNLCRFGGHTKYFYSVAQHSVLVAATVPEEFRLEALLHDASEAYLLDMPRPIKKKLPDYKKVEDNLMTVIANHFNISYPFHSEIKKADMLQLEIEHELLMLDVGNVHHPNLCWSHEYAKQQFMECFIKYSNSKLQLSPKP